MPTTPGLASDLDSRIWGRQHKGSVRRPRVHYGPGRSRALAAAVLSPPAPGYTTRTPRDTSLHISTQDLLNFQQMINFTKYQNNTNTNYRHAATAVGVSLYY